MKKLPRVACLCPTYRRPAFVADSIAQFLAQDYPASHRQLIVLDDAGDLEVSAEAGWMILSTPNRFPTLSAKYNALAQLASDADIFVVWEDDDLYLPWHIRAHVEALEKNTAAGWSHPWSVLTDAATATGELVEEETGGRFHAALAFRREALEAVGGWPDTGRATFDQELVQRLQLRHGPAADPRQLHPPSFAFRWQTGTWHCQHFMTAPTDDQWYAQVRKIAPPAASRTTIVPKMLDRTIRQHAECRTRFFPPLKSEI